jgi:hypothetical protein
MFFENNLTVEGSQPLRSNLNFNSNILYKYGIEFQSPSTGVSIFVVCSFCNSTSPTLPSANNMVTIFSSNYRSAQPAQSAFSVSLFNYSSSRSNFIINTYDLSNYVTFSNQLLVNNYTGRQIVNALCFNSNFGGTFSRAYVNGTNVSCNTNPINISSDINTFNVWLGDWTLGTNNTGPDGIHHLNSGSYSIHEVLIYNRVLTESEISSVNQYLVSKNSTAALANSGNFQY